MLKSAEPLLDSADSLSGNQDFQTLEQLNYRAKQHKLQRKSREKIEENEHKKVELDLEKEMCFTEISNENELNKFLENNYPNNINAKKISHNYFQRQNELGLSVSVEVIENYIKSQTEDNNELSAEDQIKNYKEELTKQGKSQSEILQLLIAEFEGNESISVWVENWKSYLKLYHLAESKPLAEKTAIFSIINKADFTSETAFSTSLVEISQSADISNETKLEISREFNGANVFSVDDMNYTLKEVKNHKEKIENAISTKSCEKSSLDLEIDTLEDELEKLPLDDPKRKELEAEINQKKEALEQTENEINQLEKEKPKDISFQLREGFSAKLNPDGSRSIKILAKDFAIKLPSNFLPLTTTKNLRAINLSFPYLALKNQNIADYIFSPNLDNNSVPSKSQRDIGHLIISTLGFDDKRILSEENIKQLNKDLSKLTLGVGRGQENLIELEIYDISSQSIDKTRLAEVLKVVREGRDLEDTLVFEKIKNIQTKG